MVQRWNKDLLESRMTSKESCPVWGGAVGKVPYQGQLAGRLLYVDSRFSLLLVLPVKMAQFAVIFAAKVGIDRSSVVFWM